jgi:leader peptidase (prepilin peptidase)/N-methyltransferase
VNRASGCAPPRPAWSSPDPLPSWPSRRAGSSAGGDVTLAIPIAAALGWHSWAAVYAEILLGFGAAAVTAITLRRVGRLTAGAHLPLGPFLIAAAAVVVVWP